MRPIAVQGTAVCKQQEQIQDIWYTTPPAPNKSQTLSHTWKEEGSRKEGSENETVGSKCLKAWPVQEQIYFVVPKNGKPTKGQILAQYKKEQIKDEGIFINGLVGLGHLITKARPGYQLRCSPAGCWIS